MEFNWDIGYQHPRAPVFARNAVATTQPLAAQAGLHILRTGGNAVDATIATAAALTIVEPVSNGLGSDAFAIIWDGSQLHGLNASGRSPAAWNPDYFAKHNGVPERGVDSITIPGAVSAWGDMHKRFGQLPFADVLQPAIELAESGFAVSPAVQRKWANQAQILNRQPGFREVFMPHGRAPQVGERFHMPGAARLLRTISEQGASTFYHGEIAQKLCAYLQQHGASITVDDLAAHSNDWCGTISQNYRDYQVHEIPPNGQGIAALMALGMLEHFDLDELEADSVDARHLQIECMKAAFADVYQYVGDQDYMHEVSAADLLDAGYLEQRARSISKDKATLFSHGNPPQGGTIYLTAADANGMMVSFIQSNYMGFGSGVVMPDLGVSF
ncbi:MAG: gamma-glutamyltransferase, partial [Pseudomonadota bacterium]